MAFVFVIVSSAILLSIAKLTRKIKTAKSIVIICAFLLLSTEL
ncbi:hypothetical protein MNB_SV-5-1739 [hydrothermal vent metagenome]|uniref:Uncharacterized protein n=1 Tax=hydrothermal vent metagenome TaxID=652676 RepID=A0A1W1EBK8_9ZZZZ